MPDRKVPESPLLWIAVVVVVGIAAVWLVAFVTSDVCSRVTAVSPLDRGSPRETILGVGVHRSFCVSITLAPPWLQLAGLLASPSVLLTWLWREQKRRDDQRNKLRDQDHKEAEIELAKTASALASHSAAAERFAKGAELIARGNSGTDVVGGLYYLWTVAIESPVHRPAVTRTLCGFVRRHAPVPEPAEDYDEEHGECPFEIQTCIGILVSPEWGSEEWRVKGQRTQLDLPSMYLALADLRAGCLSGAHLSFTVLYDALLDFADLRGATLLQANLAGCSLKNARLQGANLYGARLHSADLTLADLRTADLRGTVVELAKFCEADLRGAVLQGVDFVAADLSKADLGEANLAFAKLEHVRSIDGAVFTGATYNAATTFPPSFDPNQHGMKMVLGALVPPNS